MSRSSNVSLLPTDETATDQQLVTKMEALLDRRAANRLSRRTFLAAAGVTAGAAGAAAITGCSSGNGVPGNTTITPTPPASTGLAASEIAVLNFALNLEYLEASFYLYIVTGNGLEPAYMGTNPGAVTGASSSVAFTDPNVAALAQQLADDEQGHVLLLRSYITSGGGTPVDMPALNLAALGSVTSDATFLAISRALETTGTSAYEGGITYFVSDLSGLSTAAIIHDTEGQHEGTLRQFCVAKGVASPAVDAMDIPPTLANIFNTNANGLNAARTPSQVLQIVYAAPGMTGVTSGGFYPSGMNGTIVST